VDKTLHVMTLAPESDCFWQRGISYLYGDLRNTPLRDNYYDTIVCASVLEHIGFDNSAYTADARYRESNPDEYLKVVKELRRVLKPGGHLLLTVPFGKYERQSWYQQFDRDLLSCAIDAFGPVSAVHEDYFLNTTLGWLRSTAEECRDAEYGDANRGAGAVACVQLVT
jgi:ubiquinone/menaquinone biosynthesis C-methylase UbiE